MYDAFIRRRSVNAQDFETLLQTVHRRALATASQVVKVGWRAAFVAAVAAEVDALIGPGENRRAGLRGPRARPPSPSPRHRCAGDGGALQRGRFRPFEFGDSVRLRPDGALRRPPPEDLHHAVGTADPRTRLPPLRRLPPGKLSARPGPGSARHLAVTGHHAPGRIDGSRGSVLPRRASCWRPGDRCRDPTGRTTEALGREVACDERAGPEQTAPASAPTMYLGLDGTGVAGTPRRSRRAPRQAARWLRQDPRGQARHGVDGRRTRPTGPSPP